MRTKRMLLRAAACAALSLLLATPATPAGAAPAAAAAAVQPAAQAASATFTASSQLAGYPAANLGDGNQATYWESTNNQFPQWVQADLGAPTDVAQLVLKLPAADWGARTETFSVQGSTDGTTFTDLKPSAGYVFDPAKANTVTVDVTGKPRYVRLNVTANTGWPAAQLSEFEVHGPAGGDTQPPSAPGTLAYTQPDRGQIRLTWSASTDNTGVTGYDVYANNQLRGSVAGNVLTYTDTQPDGVTVSYFVRARDAAGNQSANSTTVTRTGTQAGTNLAPGKPITASSTEWTYVAANANDDSPATYWEGGGGTYPNLLTVALGANADLNQVVVKLNPDPAWGPRTQTIAVEGREQSSSAFTTLAAAQSYSFTPATGNTVTIPLGGRAADVRLRVTANSGAGGGQVAEFQVFGVPAPNPDLTISGVSWTPQNPVETDAITASATVRNAGTAASGATGVNLYLGTTKVGTANVGALAAGASATVSANIGTRDAGSYQLTAKVDEANAVLEQNEANNAYTSSTALVVSPVPSSDLVAATAWSPGNPSAGSTVTFTTTLRNQGTVASAGGAHGVTVTITDQNGAVVKTLTGSYTGTIAAGATATPVTLGTWTAVNGRYTVKTAVANDANELPVKQGNNTGTQALFAGRGANMPYDTYEAEDGVVAGGAAVVGPNRTIGDLAGEASGRRAVTLNSTGSSVEFTTRAATNTLVTRFSIPDAAGGGGINATLNVYVDGTFLKAIDLTSRYAWLYGAETGPGNSPGAGPRHIYDEASTLLGTTVPAGSRIKLQKDAANTTNYAIDFVSFEQATAVANPDPAHFAVPAGFTQQDVQNALDKVRQDTALTGVYLPAGNYALSSKLTVYGKAVTVTGAGPWFTKFSAPAGQENTDIGIDVQASANGSTFGGFAVFGNYTSRIDGPGKVFNLTNVANLTIDNIWVEHQVVMVWGTNVDNTTIRNSRIRDTFADGVNLTNGSTGNHVTNIEARSTGDDSFALFAATDLNPGNQYDNVFENLTALTPWRAAGLAVYGGYNNTFRNLYIADTLTYSAITISSLDFGYPFLGFGPQPTTVQNASLVRDGGHFWGQQTFPAIWLFSASKEFRGIRVSDVDIQSPTYSGIMFQTKYNGGPEHPIEDTVLTNVSITGAHRSGDAFDAKSGIGIWANELPEPDQGPAVGSATFTGLTLADNAEDIRNRTTTFTINRG
ncbi:discoidin domain-containing protein [Amycolatopsis rifamycinica]|uniref:Glycosyl hydrolase n=1 Tax=Amycolatopsis rifamycinica TaxID=287986 RepID=A0A066TTN9_9PSEU|nr:discoidin domain-containing protein [Amycolatopsis rifamycinica]KDN18551.1 glycosyl hydrolase [Amycolatopsis rifamycinica]